MIKQCVRLLRKRSCKAKHNFTSGSGGGTTTTTGSGNTFKIALYTSSASLGAGTTAIAQANEASGTGYSAGETALTNVTPTSISDYRASLILQT